MRRRRGNRRSHCVAPTTSVFDLPDDPVVLLFALELFNVSLVDSLDVNRARHVVPVGLACVARRPKSIINRAKFLLCGDISVTEDALTDAVDRKL